jgi:hypothetical protein
MDPVVVRRAAVDGTRPREGQVGDPGIGLGVHLCLRHLLGQPEKVHRNDIA